MKTLVSWSSDLYPLSTVAFTTYKPMYKNNVKYEISSGRCHCSKYSSLDFKNHKYPLSPNLQVPLMLEARTFTPISSPVPAYRGSIVRALHTGILHTWGKSLGLILGFEPFTSLVGTIPQSWMQIQASASRLANQ